MANLPVTRLRLARALVAVLTIALVGTLSGPAFAKADRTADRQIAKASTLNLSDLRGTGWTVPPDGSLTRADNTTLVDDVFGKCVSGLVADAAERYAAHSPAFEYRAAGVPADLSPTTEIANTVHVFPSVKQAKAYLAALRSPTTRECINQDLQFVRMLTGVPGTITPLDVNIGSANGGVWYESVLDLQAYTPPDDRFSPRINDCCSQLVAFRVGRAITTFNTFDSVGVYPDTKQLVVTNVARLKKNLKK